MLPLNQILLGDAIDTLKTLPDNSIDSLVTDPPAGISFMGKKWDGDRSGMIEWVNWLSEILAEALRVMKPGACGVVWSIPRTCGWTQLAIEMAGFRVIDSIAILNGSGFPKGLDLSKAIDSLHGCDREIVGINPHTKGRSTRQSGGIKNSVSDCKDRGNPHITAPAHPEAQKWDGWKSAQLKPSHEDWFLIQKPAEGTIARNILKWGVGGIAIDKCRIETPSDDDIHVKNPHPISKGGNKIFGEFGSTEKPFNTHAGRYPANTILICSPDCAEAHAEGCPVRILGEQSGDRPHGARPNLIGKKYRTDRNTYTDLGARVFSSSHADEGTAARYFKQLPFEPETFHYFTKASKKDRSCNGAANNTHPTVKNRELMRYFARLITPPGGTILDPFGGSGSTAIGAILENFHYILIEKEQEYFEIAQARIAATTQQLSLGVKA